MIVAVDLVPVLLVAGLTAFVVSTAAMLFENLSARRTKGTAVAAARREEQQRPSHNPELSPSAAALLGKARSNAASAVRSATSEQPGDQAQQDRLATPRLTPERQEPSQVSLQQLISENLTPAEAAEFATFVADNDPERVASVLREWLSRDDSRAPFTAPVVPDTKPRKDV